MKNTIFGGTTATPTPIADLSNYYTKDEIDNTVGDIETALDELHNYAQAIIGGAE